MNPRAGDGVSCTCLALKPLTLLRDINQLLFYDLPIPRLDGPSGHDLGPHTDKFFEVIGKLGNGIIHLDSSPFFPG